MDVQSRLASLRLQPWHWHWHLTWPAISASLLGTAASGVVAQSTTALSVPPIALACRRRPLDLAKAHGSESMAAPLAMSKLIRRISMRIIELAERGAHAAPSDFVLGYLAEKNKAHPLQGLCNLDRVDDVVEWCMQVHNGDVRGVLLWEWSILLLWKKAFERRACGAR
jgi:hypothetical protein